MFRTMSTAIGNSATASRQAFGKVENVPDGIGSALMRGVNRAYQGAMSVPNQRANDALGRALLGRAPTMPQMSPLPAPTAQTAIMSSPAALDPQQTLDALLMR